MKITKYEHSCVVIEKDDMKIVIDPGGWTNDLPDLLNVVAVIVTHEHPDHFTPDHITKIMTANPEAKIFTTPVVAEQLSYSAETPQSGDDFIVDNFSLKFFGHDHAPIIDDKVPCENIGVMIDDVFANPGDSFVEPPIKPQVLAVPASAPWLKIDEAYNYIRRVKPVKAFPTHNAILSEVGQGLMDSWLSRACDEVNTEYVSLKPGQSIGV